jgi:hypothetical protein
MGGYGMRPDGCASCGYSKHSVLICDDCCIFCYELDQASLARGIFKWTADMRPRATPKVEAASAMPPTSTMASNTRSSVGVSLNVSPIT